MSFRSSEKLRALLEEAGLVGPAAGKIRGAVAVAVIMCAVGLWRFWPAAPAPEAPFHAVGSASADVAGEMAQASSESQAATEVVVHVAGAVVRPGVYALPRGSRVADALRSAGGALGNAAADSLNLARLLTDGEQVYLPTMDEVIGTGGAGAPVMTPSAGSASADGLVDINTASAQELETLPGVGPSTAQKIIDDREANGPFRTPEDLMRVPGIGPKKFDALKDLVKCG